MVTDHRAFANPDVLAESPEVFENVEEIAAVPGSKEELLARGYSMNALYAAPADAASASVYDCK